MEVQALGQGQYVCSLDGACAGIIGGATRSALHEVHMSLRRKREGVCLPDNRGLLSGAGPGKGEELAALGPWPCVQFVHSEISERGHALVTEQIQF